MPALPAPAPAHPASPPSWPILLDSTSSDNTAATNAFPAQPSTGVPVSTVCLATAQSPRQIVNGLGCTPPSEALEVLDRCRNRECQNERSKHDPGAGFEPLARRVTIDFQLFDDAGALDECTLTHCPTEYFAAHASICVPLDTIPSIRLPSLPPAPTWDPSILDAFNRHTNPTTSNSTSTDPQLGICAPTVPLTYPCTSSSFNAYGLLNVLNGSPLRLLDPIDSAYVPKGVLATALRDSAAVSPAAPAADPSLAHPAFMLRVQPRARDSRALTLSTVNLYSLAICTGGGTAGASRYQATVPVGARCSRDAECRMGKCATSQVCTLGLKTNAFGYIGSNWAGLSATSSSTSSSTTSNPGLGPAQVILISIVGAIMAAAVVVNMYVDYIDRNKAQLQATVAERVMRPMMRAVTGGEMTTVQREWTLKPADRRMLQVMGSEADITYGLPEYVPVGEGGEGGGALSRGVQPAPEYVQDDPRDGDLGSGAGARAS